jgi:hypothetical protein
MEIKVGGVTEGLLVRGNEQTYNLQMVEQLQRRNKGWLILEVGGQVLSSQV